MPLFYICAHLLRCGIKGVWRDRTHDSSPLSSGISPGTPRSALINTDQQDWIKDYLAFWPLIRAKVKPQYGEIVHWDIICLHLFLHGWFHACNSRNQPPGVSPVMPFVISMCFLLLGRAAVIHRCSKNFCTFMGYIKGPFPTHLKHIWQPMEMSHLLGCSWQPIEISYLPTGSLVFPRIWKESRRVWAGFQAARTQCVLAV